MTAPPAAPVLGIETTTPLGGVALAGDDGLIAEYAADVKGSHAPRLMEAVEQLLSGADLTPAGLSGIAVSIGPGSFTGLRVGLATAMGLARAAGLPVFPVPTLEAVAWNTPRPDGAALAVAMHARRGELYGAVYRMAAGEPEAVLPPRAARHEDFLADALGTGLPLVAVGTAAAGLCAAAPEDARISRAPGVFARPRAAIVAWRGTVMHAAGRGVEPGDVTPVYLMPSQAERALAARRAGEGASPA